MLKARSLKQFKKTNIDGFFVIKIPSELVTFAPSKNIK